MAEPKDVITDPARVAALRRTGLLDSPAEAALDRLAQDAARVMGTPMGLITLIDEDRQVFKSAASDHPGGFGAEQEVPLSYSLCRHAVASGEPLVLPDARADPAFASHPAVKERGTAAYVGVPIVLKDGHAIGAICAVDVEPRDWSEEQLAVLRALASSAAEAIAAGTAAVDAALAATDQDAQDHGLAAAAAAVLRRHEAYAEALAAPDAFTQVGDERERQLRGAIVAAEAALMRSLERFDVQGSPDPALMRLRACCAGYIEAQHRRSAASLQFRRQGEGLTELEAAAALVGDAQQAMRLALRDGGLDQA